MWASRGGGYYGLVVAITFVYLEAVDLAGDLVGVVRAWPIGIGGAIAFVVGNLVDAVLIAIAAALWPIQWIRAFGVGPTLLALLGASWVTYRITRPAILRILEPDEGELDEIEAQAAAARLRGKGSARTRRTSTSCRPRSWRASAPSPFPSRKRWTPWRSTGAT